MQKHLRALIVTAAAIFTAATMGHAQTGKKDSQEVDAAMTWFYSEVAKTHTQIVVFVFYDPADADGMKHVAAAESAASTYRNQVTVVKVDVTQHRLVQARLLGGDLLDQLPYVLAVNGDGTILERANFAVADTHDFEVVDRLIDSAIQKDAKLQK